MNQRSSKLAAALVLIAGSAFGLSADVRTHSPMSYVHCELQPGARVTVPADHPERAAYVAIGTVEVRGSRFSEGQMLVFAPGGAVDIRAETPATVMLLGGEPVGPRHIWWNLVHSSLDRIEQTKHDWLEGRMTLPPDDNEEFIPLPEVPLTVSYP